MLVQRLLEPLVKHTFRAPTWRAAYVACVISMILSDLCFGQEPLESNFDHIKSEILLWLKADALQSLNDGDKIAVWQDVSGTDHHVTQQLDANRPVYVAKISALKNMPAVRFNGLQFLLSANDFNPNFPWTVFAVVRTAGAGLSFQHWLSGGDRNIALGVCATLVSDPKRSFWAWSPSKNCTYGVTDSLNTEWHIHTYVLPNGDNTQWRWYYDGFLTGGTGLSGDLAQPPNSGVSIGAMPDGREGWYGEIAEIIIFGAILSERDCMAVNNYLQAKYFPALLHSN